MFPRWGKTSVIIMRKKNNTISLELIYSAVILLLVAILLMASNLYTTDLWLVKTAIAFVLLIVSGILGKNYLAQR
jgi:hypothetical protein